MMPKSLQPFGLELKTRIPQDLLMDLVGLHKLVVIKGLDDLNRIDFLEFARGFQGFNLLEWSFGPVMEMKEDPSIPNYLFSREHVPFHWDGAFFQVPDFLLFHCVDSPTSDGGGETLFANTEMILRDASAEEVCEWGKVELQFTTEKRAHYGGVIRTPLLDVHPLTRAPIVRFAERVSTQLNPVSLEVFGVDAQRASALEARMTNALYSDKYCYSHQWERGDFIIADNHSLLHGRNAFDFEVPRHLRRIQLLRN